MNAKMPPEQQVKNFKSRHRKLRVNKRQQNKALRALHLMQRKEQSDSQARVS
jgi:hypothetical protein